MTAEQGILFALNEIKGSVTRIDQRMESFATKEDFHNVKTALSKEIGDNAAKINRLYELRERDNHGLEGRVKKVVAEELSSLKSAGTGITALTPDEMLEKKCFLESRRSVHIWPVDDHPDLDAARS